MNNQGNHTDYEQQDAQAEELAFERFRDTDLDVYELTDRVVERYSLDVLQEIVQAVATGKGEIPKTVADIINDEIESMMKEQTDE